MPNFEILRYETIVEGYLYRQEDPPEWVFNSIEVLNRNLSLYFRVRDQLHSTGQSFVANPSSEVTLQDIEDCLVKGKGDEIDLNASTISFEAYMRNVN